MSIIAKKNKIKLSTAISIILIVSIVAAFFFWNKSSIQNVKQNEQSANELTVPNLPEPTVDSQENKIVLENWGIEITPDPKLKNAGIKYTEIDNDENSSSYGFTTRRVEAQGKKCSDENLKNIVILRRFEEKPIAVPDGELINQKPIKGHYYVLTSPIVSCSGFDDQGNIVSPTDVEINDKQALRDSLRSIVNNK